MTTFTFREFFYDSRIQTAVFRYAGSGYNFEEKIVFRDAPDVYDDAALHKTLEALFLALGINYYKAFLSETIEGVSLSKEQAVFWENFYFKGLGEFRYLNKIELKGKIKFPVYPALKTAPSDYALPERVVVPVGGGKDSAVTIEALKPFSPLLFSLGTSPSIEECIKVSGLSAFRIDRIVDPMLIQLSKEKKVFTGHIPITAMMTFILASASVLYGFNTVAFSNERSANSGNAVWEGEEINHQWSKSFEAEKMCQDYLRTYVLSNFTCFSLLRELSELGIARIFSKLTPYHFAFTSCNRQFAIDPSKRFSGWCGTCAKCAFTFLILAPFFKKEKLIEIFGKNLLDDQSLLISYQELLGLSGVKPFICVGEFEEAAQALHVLKQSPEWTDDFIVKTLWPPVPAADALQIFGENRIPPLYRKALYALTGSDF